MARSMSRSAFLMGRMANAPLPESFDSRISNASGVAGVCLVFDVVMVRETYQVGQVNQRTIGTPSETMTMVLKNAKRTAATGLRGNVIICFMGIGEERGAVTVVVI